jgi:hypothetical protein
MDNFFFFLKRKNKNYYFGFIIEDLASFFLGLLLSLLFGLRVRKTICCNLFPKKKRRRRKKKKRKEEEKEV